MENQFDEEYTESQASVSIQNRDVELSPRQADIYRNLEAIGPEIAAFYLSGIKVLNNNDLEVASYLLAHIAREIEGGLRDVLSEKQKANLEISVHMPNGETLTEEKGVEDTLEFIIDTPGTVKLTYKKSQGGHKASILQSLGVDENDQLAEQWINVAKRFAKFAHRHGAWDYPRSKEEFVPLWNEFENVLEDLVGNHFNLLNRIDQILKLEEPTSEIIKTLPNLLASDTRRAYFFKNLDFQGWLKPLRDAGWFDPKSKPPVQEIVGQPGRYTTSPWYALDYLDKVANLIKEEPCEETVDIVVDIVNSIVNYANEMAESIGSDRTDCRIIDIICTLPIKRIEPSHIRFTGVALKGRWESILVNGAIGDVVLPKLLNGNAKELILVLLEVILDAKVLNGSIYPVMTERRFRDALKQHGPAIAKLCGIEVVRIVITQIRHLIDDGAYSFDLIQQVGSDASDTPREDYAEILVNFVSYVFRLAEVDSILKQVESLLHEPQTILKRIALDAIKHHYNDLKHLFWIWHGNPLEEIGLKPELYQLMKTNSIKFKETEIEQMLRWIESAQYISSAEDVETRTKSIAYRKRAWLSALLETDNQKVISLYRKYERINPEEIKNPGLQWWTQTWSGETSPITTKALSNQSNVEIASLLNEFQQKGAPGPSVPTEEGLRETLQECVAANPKKFTLDLQPFYRVKPFYQSALFQGFLQAWRNKEELDWKVLLEFIQQIVSQKQFWSQQSENRLEYKNWVVSAIADMIAAGTEDDNHAFDVEFLPFAEEILLVLVENVEEDRPIFVTRDGTQSIDLAATFLNTTKGKVSIAMMNYALRFARANDTEQEIRWPVSIKNQYTKRLDRNIEPSYVYSFGLGAYLANLIYLDKEWVVSNINRIFPQQDKTLWRAAFSGYLFYSRQINKTIYFLLKKHRHYQKALNTDFGDELLTYRESELLVAHICIGWIEDWEKLSDNKSLIYQLINNGRSHLLLALIHYFWRQRDNLPENMKTKVRSVWRALFESLSQKSDELEYQEVLSRLSGWVALVEKIDAEVLEWLKFSVKYIKGFSDSTFFVEDLLTHASKTPEKVGDIYLEMLSNDIYPIHDQEHIQEILRILYKTGYKVIADRICNLYGEVGFDFLRSLYDENQK